jgi:DNA-directed RNA polymerase subunit M/transcription elongation factor TFIIS
MSKIKPIIDALFYEKEEIDKELKCPSCLEKFVSPRLLPCGDSICLRCIQFIKVQKGNNLFKCPACEEVHTISSQNLPRNKILEKLLDKEANEVYRNNNVEELKKK